MKKHMIFAAMIASSSACIPLAEFAESTAPALHSSRTLGRVGQPPAMHTDATMLPVSVPQTHTGAVHHAYDQVAWERAVLWSMRVWQMAVIAVALAEMDEFGNFEPAIINWW